MAEQNAESPRIHPIQRLLDNPWILLALGVLIPFISYTAWGWFELAHVPPATLP
jgi:hypothetical protein